MVAQSRKAPPRLVVVADPHPDPAEGEGQVRWRLIARNGRAIGTSVASYPDEDQARAAFHEVCRRDESLLAGVAHAPTRGGWQWRIHVIDGPVVLRSERRYDRHASCVRASRRALQTLLDMAVDIEPGRSDAEHKERA